MASIPTDHAPYSQSRMLRGTSGLFDTGLAGDAKLHASSSGIPELSLDSTSHDLSTIDPADLLAVLSPTGTVPGSLGNLPEGFAESSLEDLAGSLNSIKSEFDDLSAGDNFLFPVSDNGLGENDFLENFTDLSEYLGADGDAGMTFDPEELLKDVTTPEYVPMDISSSQETSGVSHVGSVRPIKRSASQAFESEEVPVFHPDHNDYTKRVENNKRPRLSTATSEVSDTESLLSSTSTLTSVATATTSGAVTAATTSAAASRDQKYYQRRHKNNIASKRSRETRKQKFASMEKQAEDLAMKNEALKVKVAELEELTKLMKESLIQKLAGAGKALNMSS